MFVFVCLLIIIAFGLFARALPKIPEFHHLHTLVSGIELADSITADGHKMLNVVSAQASFFYPSAYPLQPYDCGIFFTRSSKTLSSVFQNPNASYLSSGPSSIPSPLNIGLENSRRFRALPVYAVLLAYGRDGFAEMFARQVMLARGISKFIDDSEEYELLPRRRSAESTPKQYEDVHTTALFRAKDEKKNEELVSRINATRKMYVSGTKWEGKTACRIAVSTWRVEVERDVKLVIDILQDVLKGEV
jgi:glutamate/tyrosine decarboxylase-like PLP-dependent enzyme